jgi:hypothetical protein
MAMEETRREIDRLAGLQDHLVREAEIHRLEAERHRLSTAWEGANHGLIPSAEIPVDVHTYMGKVKRVDEELLRLKSPRIGVEPALRIKEDAAANTADQDGYKAQAGRLRESMPQSMEELQKMAAQAERTAGSFALLWQERHDAPSEGRDDFELGERAAIQDWHERHIHRLDVAEKLIGYANEQNGLSYVNAEAEMARNFAAQLSAGKTSIDLSQSYATDDETRADNRHEIAIRNLAPLIEEARNNGYKVSGGQAITEGFNQREVMAISEGFRA